MYITLAVHMAHMYVGMMSSFLRSYGRLFHLPRNGDVTMLCTFAFACVSHRVLFSAYCNSVRRAVRLRARSRIVYMYIRRTVRSFDHDEVTRHLRRELASNLITWHLWHIHTYVGYMHIQLWPFD